MPQLPQSTNLYPFRFPDPERSPNRFCQKSATINCASFHEQIRSEHLAPRPTGPKGVRWKSVINISSNKNDRKLIRLGRFKEDKVIDTLGTIPAFLKYRTAFI